MNSKKETGSSLFKVIRRSKILIHPVVTLKISWTNSLHLANPLNLLSSWTTWWEDLDARMAPWTWNTSATNLSRRAISSLITTTPKTQPSMSDKSWSRCTSCSLSSIKIWQTAADSIPLTKLCRVTLRKRLSWCSSSIGTKTHSKVISGGGQSSFRWSKRSLCSTISMAQKQTSAKTLFMWPCKASNKG